MTAPDSDDYIAKKRFFDSLLTVYGRKPVLEALQDAAIPVYRLHMAISNQDGGIVRDIEKLAQARNIDIVRHSRESLSRISKNRNQDQGIAVDLACPGYRHYRDFLQQYELQQHQPGRPLRLIALDRVTNPQNLGMIIRSVSASPLDGLLLPAKGCAPLSPLVIKASAGTLFRCPILRCDSLPAALADFRAAGSAICVLTGNSEQAIGDYQPPGPVIYVLGNESDGVSAAVMKLADDRIRIPMHNGVESLNVAVTAALIAFRDVVATTR